MALQKMKQTITASRQEILEGLHWECLDTKGTTSECWLNLTLPLCTESNANSVRQLCSTYHIDSNMFDMVREPINPLLSMTLNSFIETFSIQQCLIVFKMCDVGKIMIHLFA